MNLKTVFSFPFKIPGNDSLLVHGSAITGEGSDAIPAGVGNVIIQWRSRVEEFLGIERDIIRLDIELLHEFLQIVTVEISLQVQRVLSRPRVPAPKKLRLQKEPHKSNVTGNDACSMKFLPNHGGLIRKRLPARKDVAPFLFCRLFALFRLELWNICRKPVVADDLRLAHYDVTQLCDEPDSAIVDIVSAAVFSGNILHVAVCDGNPVQSLWSFLRRENFKKH